MLYDSDLEPNVDDDAQIQKGLWCSHAKKPTNYEIWSRAVAMPLIAAFTVSWSALQDVHFEHAKDVNCTLYTPHQHPGTS